jgi:hypothetical protein
MSPTLSLGLIIHTAGILVLIGIVLDAWSLFRGEITVARQPLYIYRGAVKTMVFGIYVNYLVKEVWQQPGLPDGLTTFGTAMVFLFIGLDWMVAWLVDRAEYHQVLKSEAIKVSGDTGVGKL